MKTSLLDMKLYKSKKYLSSQDKQYMNEWMNTLFNLINVNIDEQEIPEVIPIEGIPF